MRVTYRVRCIRDVVDDEKCIIIIDTISHGAHEFPIDLNEQTGCFNQKRKLHDHGVNELAQRGIQLSLKFISSQRVGCYK